MGPRHAARRVFLLVDRLDAAGHDLALLQRRQVAVSRREDLLLDDRPGRRFDRREKPKNALVKQFTKLFEIDGIKLEFSDDAVRAVAQKAIQLKTGARGLRSIIENIMLDFMFTSPDDKSIEKVLVSKECIENGVKPSIIRKQAA